MSDRGWYVVWWRYQNKAKETINALKDEIQNLSKLVEKG